MSLREHGIIHITRVPPVQQTKLELQQQALCKSPGKVNANQEQKRKNKAKKAQSTSDQPKLF